MSGKVLRVGEISFINCNILYYYLKKRFPLDGAEFIEGTPARLNALLREGRLDLCLSSSIEYAKCPGEYLLLPDYCIGSRGAVPSIRLFSPLPLDRLDGARVALTTESATTVVLCRLILGPLLGYSNQFTVLDTDLEEGLSNFDAVLLIGDRALAAGKRAEGIYSHDLSTIWQAHTGFPFVFALWILREDSARRSRELVSAFQQSLRRTHALIHQPEEELVAGVLAKKGFFNRAELFDYWNHIAYELTDKHIRGLQLFYCLACESGLIPTVPEVRIFGSKKKYDTSLISLSRQNPVH